MPCQMAAITCGGKVQLVHKAYGEVDTPRFPNVLPKVSLSIPKRLTNIIVNLHMLHSPLLKRRITCSCDVACGCTISCYQVSRTVGFPYSCLVLVVRFLAIAF